MEAAPGVVEGDVGGAADGGEEHPVAVHSPDRRLRVVLLLGDTAPWE